MPVASDSNLSSLRKAFPEWGSHPRLTTDGESFTLHDVLLDDGNFYNITFWRRDAQGRAIALAAGEGFPTDVILAICEAVRKIFKRDVFEGFRKNKMRLFFSNVVGNKGREITCFEKNLESGKETPLIKSESCSCSDLAQLTSDEQRGYTLVPRYLAEIYEIIFNRVVVGCATNPGEKTMVFATYKHRPDDLLDGVKDPQDDDEYASSTTDEPSQSAPKGSRKKAALPRTAKSGTAADIPREVFPQPIRDRDQATNADGTAAASTGAQPAGIPTEDQHQDGVIGALDAAPQDEEGIMKGLTYRGLNLYSRNQKDRRYKKPYEHFVNLLDNPGSKDPHDKAMLEWLRSCYRKAFNYLYQREIYRDVFDADKNCPIKNDDDDDYNDDYNNWCVNYAAKAVVGFILAHGKPIDKLVEKLSTFKIPDNRL